MIPLCELCGYPKLILTPRQWDRREAAGEDMRHYIKSEPIPRKEAK